MKNEQFQAGALIYGRMANVMAAAPSIGKNHTNREQGFKFRGIDDVYKALRELLAENKIFTTSEILSINRFTGESKRGTQFTEYELHIRWHFCTDDGSSVPAETVGTGRDFADKASSKAMSIAHKYAFLQVFAIPTGDPSDEPDNDYIEGQGNRQARAQNYGNGRQTMSSAPATSNQMSLINRLCNSSKVPASEKQMIQGKVMRGMSKREASETIDRLQGFVNHSNGHGGAPAEQMQGDQAMPPDMPFYPGDPGPMHP